MDVGVLDAVVRVGMHVSPVLVPEAGLDPARLPDERRRAPSREKYPCNHVPHHPEIQRGNLVEETALEIERADGDLQQLDRAKRECHRDRQGLMATLWKILRSGLTSAHS